MEKTIYSSLISIFVTGLFVTIPIKQAYSQSKDYSETLPASKMTDQVKIDLGRGVLLLLDDETVLVLGGMLDPLFLGKRVHIVSWKLQSLKKLSDILSQEGPATFGMPIGDLGDSKLVVKYAEPPPFSIDATANIHDVVVTISLVDVDSRSLPLRVQRERVKGYLQLPKDGFPYKLSEKMFNKFQ